MDEVDSGRIDGRTWIGGTDVHIEDVWTWVDGTPWPELVCKDLLEDGDRFHPCTHWGHYQPDGGRQKNCLAVVSSTWIADECEDRKDFICRTYPTNLNTNRTFTLKLQSSNVHKKIELWLKRSTNSPIKACDVSQNLPGFTLNWETGISLSK